MPSQLSFADAARLYARRVLTDGGGPPSEISPRQAHFIRDAVLCGCFAAKMMTTSPELYAKAQRIRDNFDQWKRLAIRDAKVWEVMEDCYQFGWDQFMQWYDRQAQRSTHAAH
jgi:hypothetical protein